MTERHSELYRRLGYDPRVETLALERLGQQDTEGCRACLRRLVEHLQLGSPGAPDRQVVLLFLDVLLRVEHVLRAGLDEGAYHRERERLLGEFAQCECAAAARELFVHAIERLLASPAEPGRAGHPLVERAKTFIGQNYQRRISLSSIAGRLGVSPNYLSRTFRREAGVTLTAYVQGVRLRYARELLAEGRQNISEIAYRVGYQNYRDFYRNFVKYENASPRQVQRRLAQPVS
ncbi:MAG TPA: AraC family transcriptional regulator [Candidatus Polarisedimenticolaceae bacterium]|nr:AraC family transcriptional regulator [Candidatus Polarisedimenticolaceae bacterium]